ncbi:MAG: IS3 family transposase [Pyrinomonadaceae bacterium]
MVGLAAVREAARQMIGGGMSERKACRWLKVRRKSYRYRQKKADSGKLMKRIRELALKHPRFGYRRIWALLTRAGELINAKRVYRLWRELKLALPKRRPKRKRARPFIGIMPKAEKANQIWTYDFVFDEAVSGRKLKMLTLIDEYTRECLAIEVDTSITSLKVRQILERICLQRGFPKAIRSDNGSEFIGHSVGDWLKANTIEPLFIAPGKPWQNGKCESFNGKLRDESGLCRREWFASLREARVVIETWRKFYNTTRPHSALGYLTPFEFSRKASFSRELDIKTGTFLTKTLAFQLG